MDSYGTSWFGAPDADGAFYHYGLAKLASSEAHINPCKQGRSICEALGVYGYIATAKYAKFILDHLFVNGVNNVIPAGLDHLPTEHAKRLWDYANRMCRLMDGSEHIAPAAILYHAEAEWAGEYQPFHHPAKELAKNQIDYDIIPCDALTDGGYYRAVLDGRKLGINRESYSALVVPYCARIPKAAAAFIGKAKDQGLPVYFVEGLPEGYCDCFERIGNELEGCEAVPLNALASRLRSEGIAEIKADSSEPFLRYNHFIKDGIHCLMFHNEEPERDINTVVWISAEETDGIVRYDAMDGVIRPAQTVHDNGRIGISLNLRQYEAAVYFIGNALESRAAGVCGGISEEIQPERWRVTLDPGGPDERSIILKQLCDLSAPDMFPGFGGLLKYATAFTLDTIPSDDRPCFLDLGNACDSAQVILNGKRLELRIAAPYTFDISGAVKAGRNELIAEVYTNPARSGADKLGSRPGAEGFFAAAYSALEPSGLLGPLSIAYEKA
jgi:hypothetical protein